MGDYNQAIIEFKRAEFVSIARQLCASSISVTKADLKEEKQAMNAGVNASGGGEGSGEFSNAQSKNKTQSMDQTFEKPAQLIPSFDAEQAWFHQHEPSWRTMIEGRLDTHGARTLSYTCDFSYKSDSEKAAKMTAGMQGIGLDFGGARESHVVVNEHCTVQFY